MLFVTEPGIELAPCVDNPVESPLLLVAHDLVEEGNPVAGIRDEFIVMSRRIPGKSRRGPGHAGLIDQKRVLVGHERPVAGHRLMKSTAVTVHGMRIPVPGQLLADEIVDLASQRSPFVRATGDIAILCTNRDHQSRQDHDSENDQGQNNN